MAAPTEALTTAFATRLFGSTALTAKLGLKADGTTPGIYTYGAIEPDAPTPYVVSGGNVSCVPFDTKDGRGFDVLRDILIIDTQKHDTQLVEQIADIVHGLFADHMLTISGFTPFIAQCIGPALVEDGKDFVTYVVSVKLTIEVT